MAALVAKYGGFKEGLYAGIGIAMGYNSIAIGYILAALTYGLLA
ncbi:hypothetical protein [Domibacillus aminovorans]|nr:hypothetical protein [Domibacillus aminovorans]